MNIYVAGKNPQTAQAMMNMLEVRGHDITFDWTVIESKEAAIHYSMCMREGVEECDYLVLDGLQEGMLGAYIETGMAIALNKQVIVFDIYPEVKSSIFWNLENVTVVNSFDELFPAIAPLPDTPAR